MHNGRTIESVILAAGEGSRMNGRGSPEHKALRKLLGVPLIERGLLALRQAGIERFVIILGHAGDAVREDLGDGSRLGVQIAYVDCRDWAKGNGASLYAAREALGNDRFLVAMADHWYEPAIPRRLIEAADGDHRNLLATDSRTDSAFDPADATRVRTDASGTIRALGKGLTEFNGLDCGLFLFSREVFPALERSFADGDHSLSGAAGRLAARGRLDAVDVGDLMWEDVDTEGAMRAARRKLIRSLPGRDDGLVSHLLNRRLSVPLSLAAIRLGLTPNAVSAIAFATAGLAGAMFALGHPIIGGVATQVASIVDGSDGEVARARFQASTWGGMLDSMLDRLSDGMILAGAGVYLMRGGAGWWEALAVFAAIAASPMSMMLKDRYQLATGSKWQSPADDGLARFLLASRDGRLFVLFLGGLFNQVLAAVAFVAAGSSILLAWRLTQMWRRLRAGAREPEPADAREEAGRESAAA